MEKLIDAVMAIGNWWEGTTPREHDPDEVLMLKRSERALVFYAISSLILFIVTLLAKDNAPEATGFLLPVATIYGSLLKGLALLTMASLGMLLFHLARGAWVSHRLNHH